MTPQHCQAYGFRDDRTCVGPDSKDKTRKMESFSVLLAICAGNSPVTGEFPHKGQWRGALMFSLICTRINGLANNGAAGDLRRHRAHYDVTVMIDAMRKEDTVVTKWFILSCWQHYRGCFTSPSSFLFKYLAQLLHSENRSLSNP